MKKPMILIVDDSKPILSLLKVVLGKRYDVYAATDGFQAMSWLMEGNRPDLIISDLEMPNINGSELIAYVSNSRYYDNVPVLILSGVAREEITSQCKEMNITDFLTKPFDPADLLEKVSRALLQNEGAYKRSFLSL